MVQSSKRYLTTRSTIWIGLLLVIISTTAIYAWQRSAKYSYDKLRDLVIKNTLTPRIMNSEDEAFLNTAFTSWLRTMHYSPDPIFSDIAEVSGLEESVAGIVELYTHAIPEYSYIDFVRNAKEAEIGTLMSMVVPGPQDGRIYVKDGVAFVRIYDSVLVYKDVENGVSTCFYSPPENNKIGDDDSSRGPIP